MRGSAGHAQERYGAEVVSHREILGRGRDAKEVCQTDATGGHRFLDLRGKTSGHGSLRGRPSFLRSERAGDPKDDSPGPEVDRPRNEAPERILFGDENTLWARDTINKETRPHGLNQCVGHETSVDQ